MDRMPVVAGDAHRGHDPPYEVNYGEVVRPVYERPERAERLRDALAAAGHPLVEPVAHGPGPVLAVHEPALVGFLEGAWPAWRAAGGPGVLIPDTFAVGRLARGGGRDPGGGIGRAGWFCFDTATPLVAGSFAAAQAAADVALTAADLVAGGAPAAYALCRPPGHHAGPGYYGGFCLLNNAAVAARWLARRGRQPQPPPARRHRRRRLPGGPGRGDGRGGRVRPGDPGRLGRLRHLRGRPDRRLRGDHRRLPTHRRRPGRGRPPDPGRPGGRLRRRGHRSQRGRPARGDPGRRLNGRTARAGALRGMS